MVTFKRVAVLALCALAVQGACAQNYPDKPVRIVVAYPAGGGVDFVARTLGQRLGVLWGQPVTVENKSGASGAIGADMVAKSKPDGLTLLLASPAEVLVGPIAGQRTPYNAQKAFVPVVLAGETPLAITAHPSLPAKNLQELAAVAGKQGINLTYGTPGTGSSMHFAGEALSQGFAAAMTHVPYRGAAPVVNDVLGNQLTLGMVGLPPVVAHVKAGKMKVLAVTTSTRSAALPDVPTVAELPGLAGYRFSNWMLLLAPAETPESIVGKISKDVNQVLQDAEIRQRLEEAGVSPMGLQGAALTQFMNEEYESYSRVAKARNIRFNE